MAIRGHPNGPEIGEDSATWKLNENLEFWFCNDGTQYQGVIKHKVPHGRGIMTHPDGDVYEGDFGETEIAMVKGQGRMKYAGGEVYEGEFVNGRSHGEGAMTFPDGTICESDFNNGKVVTHGTATATLPDGSVHVNDWAITKAKAKVPPQDGKGSFKYPDGTAYEGDYENGKPHGKGTTTRPDGTIYIG